MAKNATILAFCALLIAQGARLVADTAPLASSKVAYCFGSDIAPAVKARIIGHLKKVEPLIGDCPSDWDSLYDSKVLIFGDHPRSKTVLGHLPMTHLVAEAFTLNRVEFGRNIYYIAQGQRGFAPRQHKSDASSIGSHYAAYALLEELGFAFLHPLETYRPRRLYFPAQLQRQTAPYWPIRTWHLHTQHPIELSNLLNGWGPHAPDDVKGWQAMLPEWQSFLEWCIANRQNRVSWYLLMAKSWQTFADSPDRQARLRTLTAMAAEWGLGTGLTAPIAFEQQHAWTMIRNGSDPISEIHQAVDWLAATGVDFIELEMGFSEFTHPDDRMMLSWMNEVTDYAAQNYQIKSYVKVHVSTGQYARHLTDPRTGKSLNFNFLPYYAHQELGVMAHTVQFYGLDDPAPTYGNTNFSAMHDFMKWVAGTRTVLFYPETAYWVSYDIDVPLFLPIYAERRLHDLRLIAQGEQAALFGMGDHRGSRIDGQVNFSSGQEWGYWLNDVITARAAWDPFIQKDDRTALQLSLQHVTRIFGEARQSVTTLLMDTMRIENELLLRGRAGGKAPKTIAMRTGQAYLQGVDAWDDVASLIGRGTTQPAKKGLREMAPFLRNRGPDYDTEVKPLLWEMKESFAHLSARSRDLLRRIPGDGRPWFAEINDSLAMTALRAAQVYHLYESVNEKALHPMTPGAGQADLLLAQQALDKAQLIAENRALHYRVSEQRIAAWQYGPTAYHFGYLWTARTLAYWWRDEAKVTQKPLSPCFLNFVDPINVAHGEGEWNLHLPILGNLRLDQLLDSLGRRLPLIDLNECLHIPIEEPKFSRSY